MRRLALQRGILSGKMTERGSEMSDLVSSGPPALSAPENNNEDVGDPTAEIDEGLLIEEVKKYPRLYIYAYVEYMDKPNKIENWDKLCQSLFKQWSEFSPRKKKDTIKLVQSKWLKMTNNFFKSYNGVQKHPPAKRSKKYMDSMMFLIPPSDDNDVDKGACDPPNIDTPQIRIANVMPMNMPPPRPLVEIPQVNITDNPPMPSTSERECVRTYEIHRPYYYPMPDMGVTQPGHSNPNMHFAYMLMPLLNRLDQSALYDAWSEIITTIKKYEFPKRIEILQQELIYDPAVKTQENVQFSCPSTAEVPPEEEPVQENPTYPSSYGRPTNPDGEIMYPETDPEDLDEG